MSSATKEIEKEKWPALVERTKTALRTLVIPEMADLETLWSVANAVRHGNGTATTKLLIHAPQFWNQAWKVSKLGRNSDLVGNMRISDADLDKFVIAVLRFWHRAGASQVPIV